MRMSGKAEVSANRIRLDRKKMELKGGNPAELLAELQSLPGVANLNTQDFRRGGIKVKLAILGAAAALYDAGLEPSDRLGLTGWGTDGCRTENLLYFQDYMEHGRCGGRGQLFVGTLPTTPLCEAAIALGLHGPAYYLDTEGREDLLRRDLHLSLSDPALDGILLFAPDGETLTVSVVTECEFC